MATLNWYNENTNSPNIIFMLEFDEAIIENDFCELVYGLIENVQGDARRKDKTFDDVNSEISRLQHNIAEYKRILDDTETELADYKNEYIPPYNRRNGISIRDFTEEEEKLVGEPEGLTEEELELVRNYASTNL